MNRTFPFPAFLFTLLVLSGLLLTAGCRDTPPTAGSWLSADPETRADQLARHFRGLDLAMMETGYRYHELYWAGQDSNWTYAAYQTDKMQLALELALERRPARAASAQPYLKVALPAMRAAIEQRDHPAFFQAFELLTQSCNACHGLEQVGTFEIRQPTRRHSAVHLGGHLH